ncbi:FAD/NAD(P)-binding domain-containing protein [Hortaea werneckii]|nr:FAD/NAD(P)-binding domain-containing protein [Hortaea werneckii]
MQREWELEGLLEGARGTVDQGFRIYNTDGRMVNSVPLAGKTEYEGDRIMYHRQDLHGYLRTEATSLNRAGPPSKIRTSCRVTACDTEAGQVRLESGEIVQADLIIGADGIHSALRGLVVNETVPTVPTGLSAYRLMVPSARLEQKLPEFCERINPREPFTSMVMAHDCRLIMGPAREGEVYSLVGLVPDEHMHENADTKQSWRSRGDIGKMLETFKEFPSWITSLFSLADDIGLWQLRDIQPLDSWTKGRVILIGDAAHAMLPTQGQGASQTIEDAEALGAFFEGIGENPSKAEIERTLQNIHKCRHERASLIQCYSRQAAKPATDKGSSEIKMKPDEFMDYNCMYRGAKHWQQRNVVAGTA